MKRATSSIDLLKSYKPYLAYFVFFFAALLFINTWNHSFALDDYSVILEHSHVKKGWNGIPDILKTNYRNGQSGFNDGLYRPLSLVSFAIEQQLFDGNPKISHGINIFIYAFSCLLLFISLKQVLKRHPILIPLSIVLLFAVHPIHTEVVANIKGRDDLFSLLGFASTLFFSIKLLLSKEKIYWLGIVGCYIFALLSKESSIVFCGAIPLLLLLDSENNWKELISLTFILSILSIGFFFLRLYIIASMPSEVDEGNFGILNNPIAATTGWNLEWGSIFALQIVFFQKLIFPFELIHDYSYNQIPLSSFTSLKAISGLLLYAASIVLSILFSIKKKPIGYLLALYIILTLIPSQIFMRIGVQFSERLLFMPTLAMVMLFVFILTYANSKANSSRTQKQLLISTLVIILAFGLKTYSRNKDWKNNLSLYEADIKKAENSARANYNLGTELSEAATLSSNTNAISSNLIRSSKYLQKALSIYPDYIDAANNLGIVYKRLNQPDKAVKIYLSNIQKDPYYTKNYYNLATAYLELKQYENCIQSMESYVKRVPNSANAYLIMGKAAGNMNQFKRAAAFLNKSLRLDPNNLEALNYLGMAYGIQKDYANAEIVFLQILKLNPNDEQTLLNLSINYHQQNKLEKEVRSLKKLLSLYPNNNAALNQISLTLGALGRNEEAQNYRSRIQ